MRQRNQRLPSSISLQHRTPKEKFRHLKRMAEQLSVRELGKRDSDS